MSAALPIETQRLLVRCFDPDADCMAMLAVYGDPDVMQFIPGGALTDTNAVKALLQVYVEAQQIHGFSSWGLVERESGSLIGDVGFSVFEPTGDIELGYTLARAHWGRGYATEAARACLAGRECHLAGR
jgi:RimJ/RimL family protein N-acetyltransferase